MKVNMLENIFTNMPAYQSEVVYKYGQITVKIKRCHIDEYSINIDSGNLDLYNRYTIFYSNFIDLKPRIEFDNNYKKNGYWYIIENNHYFEDSWENGDIFTSKQINCILNAVKNTVEFIEQNGGAIINKTKKKEKMKIKVTQTDNNKVILEITGMKDDIFSINEDYRNRYSKYKNGILLGEMSEYFIPDGCDIDDCSVILLGKDHPMTKKCADEIITFLGASAAKLHAINHKDENYELEL